MKKEILVAIIIGFGIGLVITFGIYRAQQAYKHTMAANDTSPQPTPDTQTESNLSGHHITFTSPENNAVLQQESSIISGLTTPNSYVTLVSDTDDVVLQADNSGEFSSTFKFAAGPNIITATAVTDTNESTQSQLTIIYEPVATADETTP